MKETPLFCVHRPLVSWCVSRPHAQVESEKPEIRKVNSFNELRAHLFFGFYFLFLSFEFLVFEFLVFNID